MVWYMVMNVSVEHFGPIFTGHQKVRQYVPTEILVPTSQSTHYHNPEDYESSIFCILNSLFYCVLQTYACMRQ